MVGSKPIVTKPVLHRPDGSTFAPLPLRVIDAAPPAVHSLTSRQPALPGPHHHRNDHPATIAPPPLPPPHHMLPPTTLATTPPFHSNRRFPSPAIRTRALAPHKRLDSHPIMDTLHLHLHAARAALRSMLHAPPNLHQTLPLLHNPPCTCDSPAASFPIAKPHPHLPRTHKRHTQFDIARFLLPSAQRAWCVFASHGVFACHGCESDGDSDVFISVFCDLVVARVPVRCVTFCGCVCGA